MSDQMAPRSVLFVCTANQCRSPMAEALFKVLAAQRGEADRWPDSIGRHVGRAGTHCHTTVAGCHAAATFSWTTSLGIIPATTVFAYAAHQLEHVHSVSDIFTGKVLSAFLVLAAFTIAPVIIGRFRNRSSSPPSA